MVHPLGYTQRCRTAVLLDTCSTIIHSMSLFWCFSCSMIDQVRSYTSLYFACLLYYHMVVPIPGGCNLEFEMEKSPWLRVSHTLSTIKVDHELAAIPSGSKAIPCETESLHYEVFHYYMGERDFSEESFFDAIRLMRSVQDAKRFGREVRLLSILVFKPI